MQFTVHHFHLNKTAEEKKTKPKEAFGFADQELMGSFWGRVSIERWGLTAVSKRLKRKIEKRGRCLVLRMLYCSLPESCSPEEQACGHHVPGDLGV